MIEMSRDVWRSSPNVISHLENEAEKHLQDDEIRKEKVRQLKVRNAIRISSRSAVIDNWAVYNLSKWLDITSFVLLCFEEV